MDICLEAFRLVLLGVLTLRKTTDVKTVRTECSKTTLSLWFFIFFFLINLSNLYDRGGGGRGFLI